jgi:hypothetical protein
VRVGSSDVDDLTDTIDRSCSSRRDTHESKDKANRRS